MEQRLAYRPPADVELTELASILRCGFGLSKQRVDAMLQAYGREQTRVLVDAAVVRGGLLWTKASQYWGGRPVSAALTTFGALHASWQGRGKSQLLYSKKMDEFMERDIALTIAFPSSLAFFRRLGYEIGGFRYTYSTRLTPQRSSGVELCVEEGCSSRLRSLRERWQGRQNGAIVRPAPLWQLLTTDSENVCTAFDGPDPSYYLVVDQTPQQTRLLDYAASSANAMQAMQFALAQLGRNRELQWGGRWDDPLALHLDEFPKTLARDEFMLRIVDPTQALTQRGYPARLNGSLWISLHDDFLKQNSGEYRLVLNDGEASVERSTGGPHNGCLKLNACQLALVYSGVLTPKRLASLGRIECSDQRALDFAESLFETGCGGIDEVF